MKNYVDKDKLQEYTTKLTEKNKIIFATKNEVGSPLVASTVAEMTDTNKVYVYVGSESGYTSGNWYYYNGSAWTSGGVYNSAGFVLDDTLTDATKPAQSKAVGDAIAAESNKLDEFITGADPEYYYKLYNKTSSISNGTETITDSNIRLITDVIHAEIGDTISVSEGFVLRDSFHGSQNTLVNSWKAWKTSWTCVTAGYYRFMIAKGSGTTPSGSLTITPQEGSQAITTTMDLGKVFEPFIVRSKGPKKYIGTLYNKGVSSESDATTGVVAGVPYDSDIRLITEYFTPVEGMTFSAPNYDLRMFAYNYHDSSNPSDSALDFVSAGDWKHETLTISSANYDRVLITLKYMYDQYHVISPEDVTISTNNDDFMEYDFLAGKDEFGKLQSKVERNNDLWNLNISDTGLSNMMQSYPLSFWPMAVSYQRIRNKLYFGYTTGNGESGVAEYDYDTLETHKCVLKKASTDDHNMAAIWVTGTGTIIAAYSDGHNAGSRMHIRRSSVPESVESFDDDIVIECGAPTTYAQFLTYDNNLYLFFRRNNQEWWYTKSADDGLTWAAVKGVIRQPSHPVQYYCKFQYTTTPGIFRMCMYANPTATRFNEILTGFVDFTGETMKLYKGDCVTEVEQVNDQYGGAPYATITSWTDETNFEYVYNFTKIVDLGEHPKIRLYDVAVTDTNTYRLLISRMDTNSGNYAVVEPGENAEYEICKTGEFVWDGKYPNGASFAQDNSNDIYVIRSWSGADTVLIYTYDTSNHTFTLKKTVYSEQKGSWVNPGGRTLPLIRQFRPVADIGGKVIMWTRGFYDATDYRNFNMDLKLYRLDGKPATMDERIDLLESLISQLTNN